MARGAAQQENLLNQRAGTSFGNAQGIYGDVTKADQAILANPGYTASQINQQAEGAESPIAAQGAAAQGALARRAGATRNDAGLVAGQDSIARTTGQDMSKAAMGVNTNAANVALNERDKAVSSLSGLYGPSLGSSSSLYGDATKAMEARPSVEQDIAGGVDIFGNAIKALRNLATPIGAVAG